MFMHRFKASVEKININFLLKILKIHNWIISEETYIDGNA